MAGFAGAIAVKLYHRGQDEAYYDSLPTMYMYELEAPASDDVVSEDAGASGF